MRKRDIGYFSVVILAALAIVWLIMTVTRPSYPDDGDLSGYNSNQLGSMFYSMDCYDLPYDVVWRNQEPPAELTEFTRMCKQIDAAKDAAYNLEKAEAFIDLKEKYSD